MWRFAYVVPLALLLAVTQNAPAQKQQGKEDVKKLEADLEKLRGQLQDLEARLKKAKAAEAKSETPKSFGGPWGRMDAEQLKKMMEQFGGAGGPFGKMDAEQMKKMMEQFGGTGPWGRKGGWWAPELRKPADATAPSDVEKRLDRLVRELEELRKEIRKK